MNTRLIVAAVVTAAFGINAGAWGQGDGSSIPRRASAYINPDTGATTENPDVDESSSCRRADRRDKQALSLPTMTDKNVHIDACLFSQNRKVDGPVTWRSKGVGVISACPDPDIVSALENGPKVAYTDTHGAIRHCHQSGYQEKGAAGDREYHLRVNNTEEPGRQVVVFCYDPDQAAATGEQPIGHGCGDEGARSRAVIRWTE